METINLEYLRYEPHVLIAGATGSGKSVLLNDIICSILNDGTSYLLLIDPKRVEFKQYKDCCRIAGYACEFNDIIGYLDGAIENMERRYKYMEQHGLKTFTGAHMYIIIDELADLMVQNKKEISKRLQRLTQLARAARIHVIAATQAPDRTYTLPAPLKLNFTDKIALRCDTAIESKQIIGVKGAENLPVYGAALYKAPCSSQPKLVSIPYLSDTEIQKTINNANKKAQSI